jgi:hypothetical protein
MLCAIPNDLHVSERHAPLVNHEHRHQPGEMRYRYFLGVQVVTGSNPVSPTQVRGHFGPLEDRPRAVCPTSETHTNIPGHSWPIPWAIVAMSDYLVPVNADVPALDATFLAAEDTIADLIGVNGLGEIADRRRAGRGRQCRVQRNRQAHHRPAHHAGQTVLRRVAQAATTPSRPCVKHGGRPIPVG